MIKLAMALGLALAASTTGLAKEENAEPAERASGFDSAPFCTNVDRTAEKTKPANLAATLEREGAGIDGFQVAEAVLVSAAIDIAHQSSDPASCRAIFEAGANRFADELESSIKAIRKQRRHRYSREEPVRSIQQRLAELWQQDQAGRSAYLASQTQDRSGADFWAARLSVAYLTQMDEISKRYIEQVLQDHDWIDSRTFGQVYADHAWILVQHADDYPEFQAEVLERIRPLIAEGGARPRHYAYLYDRVAVNTGQLQRYGTQPDWKCVEGKLALMPLEDPANVNTRRAQMGLGTVESGLAAMTLQVCGI